MTNGPRRWPGPGSQDSRRPPPRPAWLRRRVFERTEDPREFGAGIYLKENSLPVLDRLGAGEEIAASGAGSGPVRIADERGRDHRDPLHRGRAADHVVKRGVLHSALRDAALRAGAELITSTTVTGARPDGTLLMDGGAPVQRRPGDRRRRGGS